MNKFYPDSTGQAARHGNALAITLVLNRKFRLEALLRDVVSAAEISNADTVTEWSRPVPSEKKRQLPVTARRFPKFDGAPAARYLSSNGAQCRRLRLADNSKTEGYRLLDRSTGVRDCNPD
ncbi:MAG: hypothetical protein LAP40_21630 [Acidobacteriia bacterium]|nr:hypothetical protein [Terriglobia bacterium]